jgi:HD-like signal output (HDOD) protein
MNIDLNAITDMDESPDISARYSVRILKMLLITWNLPIEVAPSIEEVTIYAVHDDN